MRFLIVDDNQETLILLEKIVSKHGECVTASNGNEALRLFREAHEQGKPFHLIFLDIMMPGMDGHEVLKAIRGTEKTEFPPEKKSKIAMLTALGSPSSRFTSYEEGCEYYLTKPVIKSEIIDIIEKTKEWFDMFGAETT